MELLQMITKLVIVFLSLGIVIAILGAVVFQVIDVDIQWNAKTDNSSKIETDDLIIHDDSDHLFIFMQISDIHLSAIFDQTRGPDFYRFCTDVVDVIKPEIVLATGDLTDARTDSAFGSHQVEEEWKTYSNILSTSNVTKKTVWVDIRGNHDNFDVESWNDPRNYYRTYSMSGSRNHSSHFSIVVKSGANDEKDTYAFIGVDACLHPGPRRPFNFIGLLHEEDISAVQSLRKSVGQTNMTFWFGHYPTSSIAEPQFGLDQIIDGPYFCGHLHINNLYASHKSGFMELELSDWRAKRKFRVAAVDHGLFSFVDVVLDQWPIILITNPKASQFVMPKHEPYYRIVKSSHIRTLVFSNATITSVEVKIDEAQWSPMKAIGNSPLYVKEWNPEDFSDGLHRVTVRAVDSNGRTQISAHHFSLDGSKDEFRGFSRFALRSPIRGFFMFNYSIAIIGTVLPLLIFRWMDHTKRGRALKNSVNPSLFMKLLSKFYFVSCVNKIFIPIIIIPLYSTCGPWLVGEVVHGKYGVCFVWGMFVDGSYLPGGFTYITACIFLLFIHCPATLVIAFSVQNRYRHLTDGRSFGPCDTALSFKNIPMLVILTGHLFWSYIFVTSYGIVAWFTGVLFTWSWFVYLTLWIMSRRLTLNDFTTNCRSASQRPSRGNDNDQLVD